MKKEREWDDEKKREKGMIKEEREGDEERREREKGLMKEEREGNDEKRERRG